MMDRTSRRSGELFRSGYRCAESVLLSVAESKNLHSDIIPRISTGFCGGISRTCGLCGAVSGAIMAISLFYGRRSPEEPMEQCYVPVRKMIGRFEQRFGSTNCRELTGLDLGTEEGRKKFFSDGWFDRCATFTEEAAGMALSIIEEKS